MKAWSNDFSNNGPISAENAFGVHDPATNIALSANRSPHLAWDEVPAQTKSFVLICHDPDVPSKADDVNKGDRRVPSNLPRVDFYHWILMDIPADTRSLSAGFGSDGITPRGKDGPAIQGMRHGINDYTSWFAGDAEMEGTYYGYDGPCPPFNDSIMHHYHFTVYALDVAACPAAKELRGASVLEAIKAHIVGQASTVGTYTIAQDLLG